MIKNYKPNLDRELVGVNLTTPDKINYRVGIYTYENGPIQIGIVKQTYSQKKGDYVPIEETRVRFPISHWRVIAEGVRSVIKDGRANKLK